MKFKFIFFLFNMTLLFLLAVILLLYFSTMNSTLAEPFWRMNWPFISMWMLLICGFNTFYFLNRQLFLLLEKEDWPALVIYLENRVVYRGNYSSRLVRLLAYSNLVLSNSPAVISLENKIAMAKPALLDAHALLFGTARVLARDITGALRFFEARKKTAAYSIRDWVCWYHGFTLLLSGRIEEASDVFIPLTLRSKDGVITALSSYFLNQSVRRIIDGAALIEVSQKGRDRALKLLPALKNWDREMIRLSTEIHGAAITKYLNECARWVYA